MKIGKKVLDKPLHILVVSLVFSLGICVTLIYFTRPRGGDIVYQMNDVDSVRSMIANAIDCDATFRAAGIDPFQSGWKCNTNSVTPQKGPYLRLKRQTLRGIPQWMTPPLDADGSAMFGNWRIRTTCSDDEQSLVMRAVQPKAGARDVAADRNFDVLLFGALNGGIPICYGSTQQGSTADYVFSESPASPTEQKNQSPNLKGWNCGKFIPVNSSKQLPPIHASRKLRVRVMFTGNHQWTPSPGKSVAARSVAFENSIDYSLDNGANWFVPDPKATIVDSPGTDFVSSINIDMKPGETLRVQPIFRQCNDPSEGSQPIFSYLSSGTISIDTYSM